MCKTEKFCQIMDLRTGGLIWGFCNVFMYVCLILFSLIAWYMTKDTDGDGEGGGFMIMPILLFLTLLWGYGRFLQGIFQNNTKIMASGIFDNYLMLGLAVIACVYAAFQASFIGVLCLLLVIAIYYHASAVCCSLYTKMKQENSHNPTVEYRTDCTSGKPQSPV